MAAAAQAAVIERAAAEERRLKTCFLLLLGSDGNADCGWLGASRLETDDNEAKQ